MLRWVAVLAGSLALCAQAPDELARKSAQAKQHMAAGHFADAAILYGDLVKAIPGNPGLLLNFGMALHLSGRDAEAIPVLKSALKLDPNIPPALLFLGASYLRTQQPELALAPLRKFTTAMPDHVEARQMLVDAANLAGKPAEALPHLEKLSQLQPERAGIWYELGRAYEGFSAESFLQMEKAYPESGPWFALLGDTRSKTSQKRAAFFFYRKALAKSPNLRGVHAALAEIYQSDGHPEWAATEKALESRLPKPNCTAAKSAECEFLAGRTSSALHLARSSPTVNGYYWRIRAANQLARDAFAKLESLPESAEAFRYKAETLREQKRYPEAAAAWREALRLEPGHPDFQRELASSLVAARQFDEARKILEPLLAAEPEAPDYNHVQGDLLLAQQLPDQAIPFFEKAVKADPQNLPARAQLARALLQVGRPADALPHVSAALPLDTDGALHFQLARAYQASGQAEAARAAMTQYQAIKARSKEQDRVLEEELQITAPPTGAPGK